MLSERIKNERNKLNLSQGQLGAAIGISQQAVAKWEKNKAFPDMTTLIKLSDFFNVTIDYLLTGKKTIKNEEENKKMDETRSDITKKIKINRILRNKKISELSKHLSISIDEYLDFEKGIKMPTYKQLYEISRFMGCTLESFCDMKDLSDLYEVPINTIDKDNWDLSELLTPNERVWVAELLSDYGKMQSLGNFTSIMDAENKNLKTIFDEFDTKVNRAIEETTEKTAKKILEGLKEQSATTPPKTGTEDNNE